MTNKLAKSIFGIMLPAILVFSINLNAQNYAPVKGKMMTQWGEKVTPENAREFYRLDEKEKLLKDVKWGDI